MMWCSVVGGYQCFGCLSLQGRSGVELRQYVLPKCLYQAIGRRKPKDHNMKLDRSENH